MKTESSTVTEPAKATEREFLKYTFFKVDSQWRHIKKQNQINSKQQFAEIVEDYTHENLVKTFSLIGMRGDTDFMLWTASRRLESLQEFTAKLLSSNLGKFLETPYSYLAITRKSEYLGGHHHDGQEGASPTRRLGESKYLFVYPFIKKREWYFLPYEDRKLMMQEHFKIGHAYPSIKIHTGYSFGLDDQEFVLAFETDNPADFSELVMELRSSKASKYTALETPTFTCITMEIRNILNLLD